jgi:hypothetical protein
MVLNNPSELVKSTDKKFLNVFSAFEQGLALGGCVVQIYDLRAGHLFRLFAAAQKIS